MRPSDLPVVKGLRSANRHIRAGWIGVLIAAVIVLAAVLYGSLHQRGTPNFTWVFIAVAMVILAVAFVLFLLSGSEAD